MKFWDLETQHCFKTLVEHRSEVHDFVTLKDDTRLVTGSGDSELRVWNIDYDTQVCTRACRIMCLFCHMGRILQNFE